MTFRAKRHVDTQNPLSTRALVINIADIPQLFHQEEILNHKVIQNVSFISLIEAQWHRIATGIWVNNGSDNGLLPDVTKPLPEPMLTYHHYGNYASSKGNFIRDTTPIDN